MLVKGGSFERWKHGLDGGMTSGAVRMTGSTLVGAACSRVGEGLDDVAAFRTGCFDELNKYHSQDLLLSPPVLFKRELRWRKLQWWQWVVF